MQIHISKPGGQKEGPYTVAQVNQALAEGRIDAREYWAWYEGLDHWVALSAVPGVKASTAVAASQDSGYETTFLAVPKSEYAGSADSPGAGLPVTQAVPDEGTRTTAGMPFSALEQVFILTTGEGPAASRSSITTSLLREIIGEDWEIIRQFVPRDAIARCSALADLAEGQIPSLLWKMMTAFKPVLLQQAKEGAYRICIRSFRIENGDFVSVFLFYNKSKLT